MALEKVIVVDKIETWGPETNPPATVHMDMVRHYVSVDPLAEVDPSFVSLEVV